MKIFTCAVCDKTSIQLYTLLRHENESSKANCTTDAIRNKTIKHDSNTPSTSFRGIKHDSNIPSTSFRGSASIGPSSNFAQIRH